MGEGEREQEGEGCTVMADFRGTVAAFAWNDSRGNHENPFLLNSTAEPRLELALGLAFSRIGSQRFYHLRYPVGFMVPILPRSEERRVGKECR